MMKRNITMLIKPASSLCNLRCKYCFYADIAEKREVESYGIMQDNTMQILIDKALDYANGGAVNFAFQGGEPTVAPLQYFKDFVAYANEKNVNKSYITYALQTNGTLLTHEHCQFFHDNNFLIGISIDGKADIHNAYRIDAQGKGTFNKVMQAVDMLKKYKVEFNVLTVVTALTAKNAKNTYNFLKSHGMNYMQFITCLEPVGVPCFSTIFAPNSEQYYEFYKTMLDLYIEDKRKGNPVSIRYFDNILAMLNGQQPELCGMSGVCSGQLIIESNGNCYPCDFYCEDKYLMGNIENDSLEAMAMSENMKKFRESSLKIDEKCKTCNVYSLCRGGCRRERDYLSNGDLVLNMYCDGRKKFFEYFVKKIQAR